MQFGTCTRGTFVKFTKALELRNAICGLVEITSRVAVHGATLTAKLAGVWHDTVFTVTFLLTCGDCHKCSSCVL